jgi:endonuclease III
MATPNRVQILNTTFKILKKYYQPVNSVEERSVLEHLIYALCLENSPYEKADEAFAGLQQNFFDWNEIRVTTVTELAETCRPLTDPAAAAGNIRLALHSIFESQFSFDLEPLKKENIGKTTKQLEKHAGITPFAIGYVVQHGLGGHAIPVDEALILTMLVLGVITPVEAEKKIVPGVERAIPKSKGIEFGSLIHQLTADFHASPRSPRMRSIILEISPDAKDRFPKRPTKKKTASSGTEESSAKGTKKKKPPASPPKASSKKPAKKESEAEFSKKKEAEVKKKSTSRRLAKQKPR